MSIWVAKLVQKCNEPFAKVIKGKKNAFVSAKKKSYLRTHNQLLQLLKEQLIILSLLLFLPFFATEAQIQQGKASYYANEFVGQRTASGEVFTQNDYTCAHRSLPFGTLLRVKNLDNGREVTVRVNDRGPFVKGRIIDLSYAAARDLGMVLRGTCNVEIWPVDFVPKTEEEPKRVKEVCSPEYLYGSDPRPWHELKINDAPLPYEKNTTPARLKD